MSSPKRRSSVHVGERPLAYAGFGSRALALIIDVLIWVPFIFPYIWFYGQSIPAARASFVLFGLLGIAYLIVLHAQWGQTVGKMVARIRVTRVDGAKIGYARASMRSLVDILISVAGVFGFMHALSLWSGPEWSSLDFFERQTMITDLNPISNIARIMSLVWMWSELVVLLMNRKRRALHDFIAGTVVVHVTPKERVRAD